MSSRNEPDDLQDVKFVGPATAAVLEHAGISADDVVARRVSHAQLVAIGVHPGVAAKIRREHSLAWSLEGGEDLDRRAKQIRGLQDNERAWIAASSGSWEDQPTPGAGASAESAETDGDRELDWTQKAWPTQSDEAVESETAELAWQKASEPTPVTDLENIGRTEAEQLSRAGINSVRSLATASPEHVADSLGLEEETVRSWRDEARKLDE